MNDKYNKQESLQVVKEVDVLVVGGGPAAVISIEDKVAPRSINIRKLQKNLLRQGCILDTHDISQCK